MSWVTSSTAAPASLAVPVDEPDDRLLVGEVEARERLIAQQQARVVGERLADAQPLLLATGEQSDGAVGELPRADLVEQRGRLGRGLRGAGTGARSGGRPRRG